MEFPRSLQKILEEGVLHLWDDNYPKPDLTPLGEWLEVDGWNEVVAGLFSSCIYASSILEDLNDENLIEYTEVTNKKKIKKVRQKYRFLGKIV